MMPVDTAIDANTNRLSGLDNVREAARDLAGRVRDTTISVGEFATEELAFVVGLAEGIRDRTISPEVLREARALPVLSNLRTISHRVVDLGFDAASVGVKLGSDAVDDFLAPRTATDKLSHQARSQDTALAM